MKKISLFTKYIFYFLNFLLIILYIYPGSIFGWILYGDFQKQPQLSADFFVSSNHVYAFLVLTFLGVVAFDRKKIKKIFVYLFCISLILEFCHNFIPHRSFEYADLYGNFFGVLIVFLLFKFYEYIKSQK